MLAHRFLHCFSLHFEAVVPMADSTTPPVPKVTRNQQVVLTAPPTVAAMIALVQPALDRLTASEPGVQLLVPA